MTGPKYSRAAGPEITNNGNKNELAARPEIENDRKNGLRQ